MKRSRIQLRVIGISTVTALLSVVGFAEAQGSRPAPAPRVGKQPGRPAQRSAPTIRPSQPRRETGKPSSRPPSAYRSDGRQRSDAVRPQPSVSRAPGRTQAPRARTPRIGAPRTGLPRATVPSRPELIGPTSDPRPILTRPTPRSAARGVARDRSEMIRDAARPPERFTSRPPTSAVERIAPLGTARGSRGNPLDRELDRNPEFLSTAIRRGLVDATFSQTSRLRSWDRHFHSPCRFPPFDLRYYRSCYRPRYRYCEPIYGYSFVSLYHDPWWWRDRDVVYVNTYPESTGVVSVTPTPAYADTNVYPPSTVAPDDSGDAYAPSEDGSPNPAEGEAFDGDLPEGDSYDSLFEAERREWIEAGTAAFAAGRYDEASRSYAQAMLADERDGFVKCLYAASKFAAGDYGLAAVALRRALLTSEILITTPPDVRAFYGDSAAFDAHLAALETTVRERPAQRDAAFLLGYWYYSTGRPEQAEGVLRGVVAEDDRDELASELLIGVQRAKSLLKPQ